MTVIKKIMIVLTALIIVFALSVMALLGFMFVTDKFIGKSGIDSTHIWTDKDTGVQYIIYQNGGITPRFDSDGGFYIDKSDNVSAD